MKYYLKEEFLHDNNAKNAGNKRVMTLKQF